jgi:proline iminopeptidase
MAESGYIQTAAGEIFFERHGSGTKTPLVCVHGGPGFTSYYLEPLSALSGQLPIVLYDQAGCGRSRRGGARKLFSIEGFVDELETLRQNLGVDQMHLFGHSFGGLIIGEYALRYPERVRGLIFACVSIDIPRWIEDGQRLLGQLNLMQKMVLREGARTGATSSPAYLAALQAYYKKHIYGCEEIPKSIRQAEAESDAQTYHTVWGADELVVNGLVREYSLSPRLPELSAPTLFMCGRFDEATPEAHEYFSSLVPGSKLHVFECSAHHPIATETEESLRVVRDFLNSITAEDRASP